MITVPRAGFYFAVVAVCVVAGCKPAATPASYSIRWEADASKPMVEVTGLSAATLQALEAETRTTEQWTAILGVYTVQAGSDAATNSQMPPMLGTWRVQDGALRFTPQYPFARGVHYRAEFHPAQLPGGVADATAIVSTFILADSAKPSTTVTQIYPSVPVLPENQLKFYVQFSAPMSRGDIYRYIHLRDAAGRDADLPFIDIDEELWDPTMTRVTLLIDPGRIKRGVKPLVDLGPVFEDGKNYSLTIDAAWRDAAGQPLRETYRKEFRIGPADRTTPDPARWTVRAPAAGTREPLTVTFDEPMDRALALRMINVAEPAGGTMPGESTLAEQERQWSFTPAQPWRAGAYKLVVATTIEDLAGNNIGKVFDVDVFENVQRQLTAETVAVPFDVK